MDSQFYTIEKVAEILGLHHKTIRKFINEGKLPASKLGKQWRISGHDLSIFMEKDNRKVRQNPMEQENGDSDEFSVSAADGTGKDRRVNVSAVVDIDLVDQEEYFRISNSLMALLNCKGDERGNATIHMKYDERSKRLKVILWGGLSVIEDMLGSVAVLVEQA